MPVNCPCHVRIVRDAASNIIGYVMQDAGADHVDVYVGCGQAAQHAGTADNDEGALAIIERQFPRWERRHVR